MSYPFGATTVIPPALPDLPFTLIQRRQGDVKATLIRLTLNGQPVNITGYSFTFSAVFPAPIGTLTTSWTVQGPSSGVPITTIVTPGFAIPSFNSSVSVPFNSTSMLDQGEQIFITGAGIYTVTTVTDQFDAVITNSGLEGNLSTGTVTANSNVYQVGQVGMTVMVIPSTITGNAPGLYPMFVSYATSDPAPGPYIVTVLNGQLQLFSD